MRELLEGAAQVGVAGLALLALIMLIDLLRRKFREGEQGERREPFAPKVVNCPNKIEGLAATLAATLTTLGEVRDEARANRMLQTEQLKVLTVSEEGIDRLVEQHKPDGTGREMWKWTARSEGIQEESRDLLREIAMALKKNGTINRR